MNLSTLRAFRHEVYQSFKQARDALFNLADALASEDRAQSLPELSLSPFFERKWSSTYEALEDGIIDTQALQKAFITHLPQRSSLPLIAVDSTSIARPKARTSEDRSAQYVHNLPGSAKPVTYGWQFSTVVSLPEKPSGWTYVLDQRRVSTATTALKARSLAIVGNCWAVAQRDHRAAGSGIRFGLVVVPAECFASPGLVDPFEKQPLLLPTRSGSHRQTWRSPQTRGQAATE